MFGDHVYVNLFVCMWVVRCGTAVEGEGWGGGRRVIFVSVVSVLVFLACLVAFRCVCGGGGRSLYSTAKTTSFI